MLYPNKNVLIILKNDHLCVAVRYMIHFYCLAVEAGFYSDVVECWTLNPADRVWSQVGENVIWIFSPFLLHLVASVGVAALEPDGRSKCWVVTRSLRDICIGMNAYKCHVIGRRDVAVRYMIHFYCLAVEAGFYSDVVECWTLNPADRFRSPVGENVIWIFSPFLLHLVASVGVAALEPDGRSKCWVVTRSLRDICIGMNAYKCHVIGRRDVAVRYMIHFYCLAVEAGFYSDVVECWTLNPADRVWSPVGENVIWIFSPFLLHMY